MRGLTAWQFEIDSQIPYSFLFSCSGPCMQKLCPTGTPLALHASRFGPTHHHARPLCVRIKTRRSRARDAGSNAFRISIEWARIVPQRGVIDEEAVKHYHRMFDQIDACALMPGCRIVS